MLEASVSSNGPQSMPTIPNHSSSAMTKSRGREGTSIRAKATKDETTGSSFARITNGSITILDITRRPKAVSELPTHICVPVPDQGCIPPVPAAVGGETTADSHSSSHSWSPVTYNGSISAEEEFCDNRGITAASADDVFSIISDRPGDEAVKSCEVKATVNFITDSKNEASSAPSTPSSKKRGLRAWIGKKIKRKSKSKSPQNPSSKLSSPRRSISAASSAPAISSASPFLKKRSKSEYVTGNLSDDELQVENISGGPMSVPLSRKVSYTCKVGHITAKYERLAQEAREEEKKRWRETSVISEGSPTHLDLSLGTIETFQSCLLYHQLKYKVGIALQSVQSPMLSMGISSDGSMKEQLQHILQEAESRYLWHHDESQTVFLQETLRQLVPLREEQYVQ